MPQLTTAEREKVNKTTQAFSKHFKSEKGPSYWFPTSYKIAISSFPLTSTNEISWVLADPIYDFIRSKAHVVRDGVVSLLFCVSVVLV